MAQHSRTFGDWILLLFLVLVWGSSFVSIKYIVEYIPPMWIAAMRLTIAAILMGLFAFWRNIRLPNTKKEWIACAAMGALGTAMPFMLINYATQFLPSSIAGLMMATVPIQVMLLSLVFLPEEKATLLRVMGLAAGFLGVTAVILGNNNQEAAAVAFSLLPFILLIIATSGYASNSLISRRVLEMPAMTKSLGVLIFAAITASICALIFEPVPNTANMGAWAGVIYLALLPTWATTIALYVLLDRTSAAFVTLSNYFIPAASIIFGAVLFQEQLSILQFVGFGIILLGVGISEGVIRPRKRKKRQYPPPPSA